MDSHPPGLLMTNKVGKNTSGTFPSCESVCSSVYCHCTALLAASRPGISGPAMSIAANTDHISKGLLDRARHLQYGSPGAHSAPKCT